MEILRAIEAQQIKADLPDFGAGDTVKVHIKVTEGKRERIQIRLPCRGLLGSRCVHQAVLAMPRHLS